MDKERRKKIQTTKLVITEIFMLVTIVVTVVILTFIVMGYHLTEDGRLEQSGLVQVESIPTGATVIIDGETLPNKTDTSKILKEGEHTVKIEKPGFSSWEKTISAHPGFLTKLSYPRLYKIERTPSTVWTFETAPDSFAASRNRDVILTAENSSAKLSLFDIDASSPKRTEIDLSELFADKITYEKSILDWNKNSSRIILKFSKNGASDFAVVDLEYPERSLGLLETFGFQVSDLAFLNDYGDKLFILENGHLRTLSLSDKQASGILVDGVEAFSSFGEIAFVVTKKADSDKKSFGLYDSRNKSVLSLLETSASVVRPLISEYLGRFTFAIAEDNNITIYRSELPNEKTSEEKPLGEPVGKYTTSFGAPGNFYFSAKNQVVVSQTGADFAIFDLENYTESAFTLPSALTFWPDEYTIGLVSDEKLSVYDFDGTNRFTFGRAEAGFPAVISKNGNYLYFVQKNSAGKLELTQENIK